MDKAKTQALAQQIFNAVESYVRRAFAQVSPELVSMKLSIKKLKARIVALEAQQKARGDE